MSAGHTTDYDGPYIRGQSVYIFSVDMDGTMRSSRMPYKVFDSKERAEEAQKNFLAKWPLMDTEITQWTIE